MSGAAASASTLSDLENKKNQLQQKNSSIQSNILDKDHSINHVKGKQSDLSAQLEKLEAEMAKTDNKINDYTQKIADTKAEIEQLKKDIIVLEDKIAKRTELLKERARSYQTTGGKMNYLEVVLGSSDFGDFVERVGAVSTIMDADNELIEQQKQDKKELEEKKKLVETKLNSLQDMMDELKTLKANQVKQKQEKNTLMKKLKEEQKELEHDKLSMEEESAILSSQESSIQKAIQMEKQRQAELAAQRAKEEAEQKRQAALAAKRAAEAKAQARQEQKSQSASVQSAPKAEVKSAPKAAPRPQQSAPAPSVSSGLFMKPAAGVYSSGYGGRWGATHFGTDIANASDVPIMAAADGVVTRSYLSSSYGNVVFVSHYLNGKVYTTVYAHMETRLVGNGQTVRKGQQIGIMGNTGQSTGQHLHFEIHEGPWNASKSNAVDPMRYL